MVLVSLVRRSIVPPGLPPFSTIAWNSQIGMARSNAHRISWADKIIESFADEIAHSLPFRVFKSNITFH